MKTPEYYMKAALKEAEKAKTADEVPVGAVIVKNDRIIARAHNLREKNQLATSHAELLAIQKASKKLKSWCLQDCDLYVTLEPCMMCIGTISLSRINHLYFGASDPKGGATISLLDFKTIRHVGTYPKQITSGIMEKECSEILKNFFREKRNRKKEKRIEQ